MSVAAGNGCGQWNFCGFCCEAKPWLLVTLLCVATFFQGFVVHGLVNITISPLQKRFQLSSQEMGLVVSSYHIAAIVCILPVTYLGARAHKPLVVGTCFILVGIGSVVYSLPHFLNEPYADSFVTRLFNGSDLCPAASCDTIATRSVYGLTIDLSNKIFFYSFFIAGQVLNGMGSTALVSMGTVYIDENLSQTSAPIGIGLFEGIGKLGPAVGYLLGGSFLNSFVDGSGSMPFSLTTESELWIGNWWLGFILGGGVPL